MIYWVAYILSIIVSGILSGLFFEALVNSKFGRALGLQKFRERLYKKSVVRKFDIASTILIATVVTVFVGDSYVIRTALIGGCLIGFAAGFFSAIRPKHIAK